MWKIGVELVTFHISSGGLVKLYRMEMALDVRKIADAAIYRSYEAADRIFF